LTFERTEGHYIGAVGINTIVSFGLLVLLLSAFFIATHPDIPAGPWVFGAAAIYGLVPVFYYPISQDALDGHRPVDASTRTRRGPPPRRLGK
jgi:hypothetical protein